MAGASKAAAQAVEKAGGKLVLPEQKVPAKEGKKAAAKAKAKAKGAEAAAGDSPKPKSAGEDGAGKGDGKS